MQHIIPFRTYVIRWVTAALGSQTGAPFLSVKHTVSRSFFLDTVWLLLILSYTCIPETSMSAMTCNLEGLNILMALSTCGAAPFSCFVTPPLTLYLHLCHLCTLPQKQNCNMFVARKSCSHHSNSCQASSQFSRELAGEQTRSCWRSEDLSPCFTFLKGYSVDFHVSFYLYFEFYSCGIFCFILGIGRFLGHYVCFYNFIF